MIIDNYGDAGWPEIARYVDTELLPEGGHPYLIPLRVKKIGRTMVFKKKEVAGVSQANFGNGATQHGFMGRVKNFFLPKHKNDSSG